MTQRVAMLFGDSNTHGTCPMADLDDVRRHGPAERWPGVAGAALGPGWRLIDEGHPGRTTVQDDPVEGAYKNGARALPALLESHRPIDLVVIKLGTNDLKARFSVTASDIALSVDKLILMVQGSDAGPGRAAPAVLLIAPPPIAEAGCLAGMFTGGAVKSRQMAARMAEVAARRGVPFLDAGALIAADPLDGIHYDAAAHAVLGQAVAAAIRIHWP